MVSRKSGTAGAPYTPAEPLTLRNTARTTSSGTSCPTTRGTVCTQGICPFTGSLCYPPVIK